MEMSMVWEDKLKVVRMLVCMETSSVGMESVGCHLMEGVVEGSERSGYWKTGEGSKMDSTAGSGLLEQGWE